MFEWDSAKNQSNLVKHGMDFSFATEAFNGNLLEIPDERQNYGETRIIAIGLIQDIYFIPHCNQRTSRSARRGWRKRIKHTCAQTRP